MIELGDTRNTDRPREPCADDLLSYCRLSLSEVMRKSIVAAVHTHAWPFSSLSAVEWWNLGRRVVYFRIVPEDVSLP